jgi:hypothetical protein
MSLIEKTKELAKLDQAAKPGPLKYVPGMKNWTNDTIQTPDRDIVAWGGIPDSPNTHLLIALRNAAPAMLAVLGQFEPGDEEIIRRLNQSLDLITFPVELKDVMEKHLDDSRNLLTRLQRAAQLMEANHVFD